MRVTLAATGKFHFLDLAHQMQRLNSLGKLYTAYPKWKLRHQIDLPESSLQTFPWVHTPYMASMRFPRIVQPFVQQIDYLDRLTFDKYVATSLEPCDIYTAISSCGLTSGTRAQEIGAKYVCDRGSTHIVEQNKLLRQEHEIWGMPYVDTNPKIIDREIAEYARANLITVPSNFAKQSFLAQGIPERKISVLPYGVDLNLFKPVAEPIQNQFLIVFVGGITLRKGIQYLVQAYAQLKAPNKALHLIGQVDHGLVSHIASRGLWPEDVRLLGHIPQHELKHHLSQANVLVLPSIEDGFGLVMAQALACGCPVIATHNTGAVELITHGKNGLIVPPGDVAALKSALEEILEQPNPTSMRSHAINSVRNLGGWNNYGDRVYAEYQRLIQQ